MKSSCQPTVLRWSARRVAIGAVLLALATGSCVAEELSAIPATGSVQVGDRVFDGRYVRQVTTDRFGREITFYLSTAEVESALPLFVFVQGSGCNSHFARKGERIVSTTGHDAIEELVRGKARLLIVEKPGVEFLQEHSNECRDAPVFRREHTLERWSEAVMAAIRAATESPMVKPGRLLVAGHSEGGLVACRVARLAESRVTHVAVLSGGGPSQLFDLIAGARRGFYYTHFSEDPEARVAHLLEKWRAIQEDPENTEKIFLGFPYRRWSTFLASSLIEELKGVNARVFIAQGLKDVWTEPVTADMLHAELLARGKDVRYDRLPDADHSFNSPSVRDGWGEEYRKVLAWFGE